MAVYGRPKFDGVAVMQFEVAFTKDPPHFVAKAAYVDSKTGKTHGQTTASMGLWSQDTLNALQALRDAMEQDIAARDLDGAQQPNQGTAVVMGLGEHLSGDPQPL